GSGKSAFMGVLAAQCLNQGEAVAYFDPKHDVWAASVLKTAAEQAGCPFHILDLRPEAPPHFNLLAGVSPHELEELLIAGLELYDLGNEADHYRLADRQAAYRVASTLRSDDTLNTLYAREGQRLQRQAPGFSGKLKELARLPAAQAQTGLSLQSWFEQGGGLYILGSTRHDAVKRLQRMILLRLLQLAERRKPDQKRTMALLLDEFKYHLCRSSLDALGTVRDKGVHMVLAHQSLGDLASGPMNMDAQAVAANVAENCTLKMIYRLQDPDTAHWMSRRSGQQRIYENSWTYRPHDLLDRVALREATGPYIDENTLLSLPWGSAMLFGSKLPMEVRISPYPTVQHTLKANAAEGTHTSLDFSHLKQGHHARI
ncbi:MAG: type IV secretory system conjugative DNA transfer family protein, partial [Pseudomonadales bacterium]|nr:type IV secretory system conjugative DNA transfer family protein [Pseudomonadales bacterium]